MAPEPEPEKKLGSTTEVVDVTTDSLLGDSPSIERPTPAQIRQVFEIDTDSDSLVNLVRSGGISIDSIILNKRSSKVPQNSEESDYEACIKIKNITSEKIQAIIPKGQIFQNLEARGSNGSRGFQNIVNAEDCPITLNPGQEAVFYLPGHCLNKNLASPSGQDAHIVPLKVKFSFGNQQDVWNSVQSLLRP